MACSNKHLEFPPLAWHIILRWNPLGQINYIVDYMALLGANERIDLSNKLCVHI